ncbi:MAG TPA: hypothetical protein VFR71_04425 [Methyloceanibacter sp.]|nr:hypothetical protein [Methyloceanibacter sp.]
MGIEAKYLRGEPISATEYCTLINAQRRTLNDLGLERVARVVSPDLHKAIAKARKAGDGA